MAKLHHYVVTVSVEGLVTDKVVDNYVMMAISKYQKNNKDYFGGIPIPLFSISKIEESEKLDVIRSTIDKINQVKSHLAKFEKMEK